MLGKTPLLPVVSLDVPYDNGHANSFADPAIAYLLLYPGIVRIGRTVCLCVLGKQAAMYNLLLCAYCSHYCSSVLPSLLAEYHHRFFLILLRGHLL